MAKDILKEIVDARTKLIEEKGYSFGFEIPEKRLRKIHPFIEEKGVILEVKRASPSKGDIAPDLNSFETALTYAKSGARAISCLTEPNYFKGTLEDLMNVCRAADDFEKETGKNPPAVLRKDFLTDEQDIEISYRAGADAVLLIARILSSEKILSMAKRAESLGLSVLIEVRKDEDLEKLAVVMQNVNHKNILCGVNSRDLKDFTIDMLIPAKMFSKIKNIAQDARITFESGILSARSAAFAASMGFNAILLGEAAARNPEKAKEFTAAFENEAQKEEFAEQINNILRAYKEGYYLEPTNGFIMQIPNGALREQLEYDGSDLPDSVYEQLATATEMYYRFDANLEQKKKAINILADILESEREEVKDTLNAEYEVPKNEHDKLIFGIVNGYNIRHNRADQKNDYSREIWYDWMMQYYTSVIIAFYKLKNKYTDIDF